MKAWIQYAGHDLLSKPASLLYATYRVCSDHFTAQSVIDPGHTRLTRMAVPSVQLAAPCSLSVSSNSDCDMTAEAALQGPAVEASKSESHTLRCPDEQGGISLVAGEKISADFVLPEKTLTSRSAVTKGTCVTGRSQDCSDSTVRGTEQASQDPPEDVSANSSTPECPRKNVRSCVPATMSPLMKYKQTIKHLQAKVAAQRTHQYFTILNAYPVSSKLFGNLTVPSEAAFAYVHRLESHFLAMIEATAHHIKVCDVLYHHLSSVGDFHFCSAACRAKFLKMFCWVRLCWHVRFVNRNLDRVRFQSSISGIKLDKFKG
ncbi:uncharacterized protein LOC142776659 [Rhipicephalus microplus]|uniref:uncharacterized protein LOC142776659 n=1 Tax=Rhipicephalus microplus TaxID=6941 RepID=UPI003F6C2A77